MKENKLITMVVIVTIVSILLVFGGITYAYFTASNNQGSTAVATIDTGKMLITYNDGTDNIEPVTNIQPSDKILVNKTFTLTGSNTTVGMKPGDGLPMPYKVGLKYTSTFSDGQIHYYIKEVNRPANSSVTVEYTGTTNQTVQGNSTYTGYSHGTLDNGSKYTEMVTGNFPASTSNQIITFNLILQFPDTGDNQDIEKGATINGTVKVNYEEKITTAVDYVSNLYNTAATENGLIEDDTDDKNIRYSGTNDAVKNYVSFNNELWRIIGIFNTTNSDTNNQEKMIKLVRNDSIGYFGYTNYLEEQAYRDGINDWSQAVLMTELNTDYLNESLSDNKLWRSFDTNYQVDETEFNKEYAIKKLYQDMIANAKWNYGGISTITNNDFAELNAKNIYDYEQGDNRFDEKFSSSWNGKIGLISLSEYGYASSNEECTNKMLGSYPYGDCTIDNWMLSYNSDEKNKSNPSWTITPLLGEGIDSSGLFQVAFTYPDWLYLSYSHYGAYKNANVYPSLYLKSSVIITGGTGTETDPYQLNL